MPYLENGDLQGPSLILIHAVGDTSEIFRGVMQHLPHTIHAFALTMRGNGEASKPESGYRSSDLANDVALFMDALNINSAVVAGGSSGGLVAQRFVLDNPNRSAGLVLLGAPLTLAKNPFVRELADSTFANLTDPIESEFLRSFIDPMLIKDHPVADVNALIDESKKTPARVWRETIDGILEDDFVAELPTINAPALIVWGDKDSVLPYEDQVMFTKLIKNSELKVNGGAGHLIYWEEPERTAKDVAEFLFKYCNTSRAV